MGTNLDNMRKCGQNEKKKVDIKATLSLFYGADSKEWKNKREKTLFLPKNP